jgi:hypothetical protein
MGTIMSKHKKSSRAKSPSITPGSERAPGGKQRNGHDKKDLKETTAAEAVISPKKAEPAPAPKQTASEAAAARKKAGPAPAAAKPAAKPPARPAAQAAKPSVPAAKPSAPAARPRAVAQAEPPPPARAFAGAADSFERSFKEARQGTVAVNRKLIDFARANLNSSLEHVRDLAAATSPVRVMRLQMEFWHDCLETFASQAQELRALSAELVARANEPIREHMRSTLRT